MPPTDALAWFRSHPPDGLSEAGSGTLSGAAEQTFGLGFAAVSPGAGSAAWQAATLEIGITTAADGSSYVRLDGMTEWLDPVPLRDLAVGPRMRVAVDGPCPKTDRGLHGVQNQGEDLATSLLPHGTPTAALICSYAGVNGNAFALIRSTRLGAADAKKLASAVAESRLSHLDNVVRSCPAMDGSKMVLALSYPDRQDVDIDFSLSVCVGVGNGSSTGTASEALTKLMATHVG